MDNSSLSSRVIESQQSLYLQLAPPEPAEVRLESSTLLGPFPRCAGGCHLSSLEGNASAHPDSDASKRSVKYNFKPHHLSIFYLELMFVPVSQRIELITKVYNQLIKGGAIIIFDKEINEGGYFGTILYRLIVRAILKAVWNFPTRLPHRLLLSRH